MFRKRRNSRDDSDIYETLEELRSNGGESTPPVPPIETIPTLRTPLPTRSEPGVPSTVLRPEDRDKIHAPQPSTLQGRPGTEPVERDVSTRPPQPLPTDLYEEPQEITERPMRPNFPTSYTETPREDKALTIQPQRMMPFMLPPSIVGGGMNSLTKSRAGLIQASVNNELDSILKMRKASLSPAPILAKKPNIESKKMSLPSFRKKSTTPEPSPSSNTYNSFLNTKPPKFQIPENPSPMPTGKSAILLGLAPPPPRPNFSRPKPSPLVTPRPSVVLKPAPPLPAEKPAAPPPTAAKTKLPSPPVRPKEPMQEPVYEDYKEVPEDPIYNSDEEWTYEPLSKFNIYSS